VRITILGCGSSGGVPLIGNNWGVCDPRDPRNRRMRVSILVEEGDTVILVDTSPDMREQMLIHNVQKLTAVLYTHAHADHCHGIDELRSVNWLIKKPVDVYADPATLDELQRRFDYIFRGNRPETFTSPSINAHLINGPFAIGSVRIVPFGQDHGYSRSLGFRFNDFAYSTDVKALDEGAFTALRGVKAWVVDAIREEPHHTHSHLAQTLEWIKIVRPERAWLTHMNEQTDYMKTAAKCPPGVSPAHDGLIIEC